MCSRSIRACRRAPRQELVALLKASPGRYNFASAGLGSGVHVGGELFRAMTDTQFEIVHYRGGGPGVAAILSNEAQFGLPTMASSLGQVRGGGVRALAVAAAQRSPALPDVPSAAEAGLPNLIHEENFPILAPKDTPPEIVAALGVAFRTAIQRIAPRLIELAGVAPREGYDTSAKVMDLVREGVEAEHAGAAPGRRAAAIGPRARPPGGCRTARNMR